MLRLCIMLAVVGAALCTVLPAPLETIDCTNWCTLQGNNYYCCDEEREVDGGRPGKCPATPISGREYDIIVDLNDPFALNCKRDRECEIGEKCCYAKEAQHYRICRFAF
ncbi:uncharacterized protein LOC122258021 [Penaeus japonicus]|uniref:uncharacterized protein LOC122245069 n=1 Tax=Penaeus japonicus TaxID=27405 RepID=UPI001C7149B6|nr:uncharacterized protein LOC122245069 [Penaeus japonicus]XP_042879629.1 uncharacterized protein LOC122258021 [Penaeus japonicus]